MTRTIDNLDTLLQRQLELYPHHKKFLDRRFAEISSAEKARCERLALDVIRLAGDKLDDFLQGYEFICKIQKEEELYFRRHQKYRLEKFVDANEQVYANKPYMLNYMRGLLVTQMFWSNHTNSIGFYEDNFIAKLKPSTHLLEIGPGHGLLLARAIAALDENHVTGWDISEASLDDTKQALVKLGNTKSYSLQARNLFDQGKELFDAVVFSEVLEHLEQPREAMQAIRGFMKPDARIYINVPINSPAPDHLFLLKSPEDAVSFIESSGFQLVDHAFHPATNYSLEQARKHNLTVSVCLIAKPS